MVKNTAFVFIKPHAVTDKVKELVKTTLEAKGITIKKEGSIEAEEIDKKMLIDQHYYAIAVKATLKKPTELPIPKDKFKDQFGCEWDDMVKEDRVFNAKDACEHLGVDAKKIDELWAVAKKAKKLVKFGGGFYCGNIEHDGKSIYAFNGFFMEMRSKFVDPGVSIYYYVAEWDSSSCSWEDFRGKVLGPTDPADAPEGSLRGLIAKDWKDLGMEAACNTGDNGVHASASPFEALAERMNWLGARADSDPFGKLLLKAGVSKGTIKAWSVDPQVTFGMLPIKKSIFDTLEDTDSDYCLALCQMIASFSTEAPPKGKATGAEKEIEKLKAELEQYKELAAAVEKIQKYVPFAKQKKEPEPKAKAKAKAKAENKPQEEKKPKPEPSPEKKEVIAKRNEIMDMKKKYKKDGKSKEEMQEAIAPLLDQLKELKDKAKAAAPAGEGEKEEAEQAKED
jgi:nucleoside diphosphate kinase